MNDNYLKFQSEHINKDRKFVYTAMIFAFLLIATVLVFSFFKKEYLYVVSYFGLYLMGFLSGRFSRRNNS